VHDVHTLQWLAEPLHSQLEKLEEKLGKGQSVMGISIFVTDGTCTKEEVSEVLSKTPLLIPHTFVGTPPIYGLLRVVSEVNKMSSTATSTGVLYCGNPGLGVKVKNAVRDINTKLKHSGHAHHTFTFTQEYYGVNSNGTHRQIQAGDDKKGKVQEKKVHKAISVMPVVALLGRSFSRATSMTFTGKKTVVDSENDAENSAL